MKNISKRDVKVFILGFLTYFLINVIYDWEDNKEAFKRGLHDSQMGSPFNP